MTPVFPTTTSGKVGLVAVILLAPGGFILGATLAVHWWRQRPVADATP